MKKVHIETYGCQMNQADSEVVGAIVKSAGYDLTSDLYEADVIFVNTCSIRENAELRVKKRLAEFDSLRKKKSWQSTMKTRVDMATVESPWRCITAAIISTTKRLAD